MSIHNTFVHGSNFQHGENVIIESDVIVGDDVKLGHNVTLKSGTRINNGVALSDYVKTTGVCIIGDDVDIRTGACISKGVIIEDNAFIGSGVMTNHTKNVMHRRGEFEYKLLTRIGYGAVIGSSSVLVAGVEIGDSVVVAAGTVVYDDILGIGVYGGSPVCRLKRLKRSDVLVLLPPPFYKHKRIANNLLRRYLPEWIGFHNPKYDA